MAENYSPQAGIARLEAKTDAIDLRLSRVESKMDTVIDTLNQQQGAAKSSWKSWKILGAIGGSGFVGAIANSLLWRFMH